VGTASPSNPFQVGTSDLIVDSSGNVGIGTSTPSNNHANANNLVVGNGTAGGIANYVGTGLGWYAFSRDNANNSDAYDGGISYDGSRNLMFHTNAGSERMRINSSGNVGIGTSSPSAALEIGSTTTIAGARLTTSAGSDSEIEFINTNSGNHTWAIGQDFSNSNAFTIAYANAVGASLSSNSKVVIDSSGNVLVGTTSTTPNPGVALQPIGNVGIGNSNGNSGASFLEFRRNATQVGGVTQSGTTGVSYNTSSDHRLKENVTDVTDGITRVKQLEPKRFNFIADPDRTVDGFLAHQAQAVVPEAVTGTYNEVDDDGNAVMQGIDQSKLVPLLTAALKESIAKIEALEARVTALEGN
jgi:hypothetical protein